MITHRYLDCVVTEDRYSKSSWLLHVQLLCSRLFSLAHACVCRWPIVKQTSSYKPRNFREMIRMKCWRWSPLNARYVFLGKEDGPAALQHQGLEGAEVRFLHVVRNSHRTCSYVPCSPVLRISLADQQTHWQSISVMESSACTKRLISLHNTTLRD